MSDNLPPEQPFGGPGQPGQPGPYGPPPGQPVGQPGPYGPPPGQPQYDYLQPGPGQPVAGPPRRGVKGKLALAVGVVVLVGAIAGGGVWAWNAYFNQGPQPSEALPHDTLAYASLDLDPSGKQKVELITTLRKFPAFRDEIGLKSDDDIREKIFDEVQKNGICKELDFEDDVASWLGDRIGVAVVDRGEDEPEPVVVLQVKDEGKAEKDLDELVECSKDGESEGDDEEIGGYAFHGDWVVLAETEEIAEDVAKDAEAKPLADDDDYTKWTEAAGDAGIVTMYVAPEAGAAFLDYAEEHPEVMGGLSGLTPPMAVEPEYGSGTYDIDPSTYAADEDEIPEELRTALEDFPGGAGTVRFDDGSLEIEFASGEIPGGWGALAGNGKGGEVVATLPDTTAVALGLGLGEGWVDALLDQLRPVVEAQGDGQSLDELVGEFESETGLAVPEDIEALGGESFALAFDSEFDADDLEGMDPSSVPFGIKIKGDPERIESALDKIRTSLGPNASLLKSRTEGDHVVVAMSEDYLDTLAEDGDLGGNDTFQELVPERDGAAGVLFLNVDAGGWLDELLESMGAPEEVRENVEPFRGLGVSSWKDGEETHTLVKITTE